jgi:hypothetical protein
LQFLQAGALYVRFQAAQEGDIPPWEVCPHNWLSGQWLFMQDVPPQNGEIMEIYVYQRELFGKFPLFFIFF